MASALKMGTITRNTLTDSLGSIWNSGTVLIYNDAAMPANPQSSFTGTLLATIDIPATAFAAAATGVAAKTGTWSCTSISASGTATSFRMIDAGGTKKMDGNAGLTGTDMILDSVALIQNGTVTVNSFTLTQPE